MSLQLAHERNGLLLQHAHSSDCSDRTRILRALQHSNADLTKAQACGHCHQLTARLTESLLHHLLFAKGQLPEPVSLLRKRREAANSNQPVSGRQRSRTHSTRTRKEDRLLRKLDQLRLHLEQAAHHLAPLADNKGEGPSCRPYAAPSRDISPHDLRLLVVMGASAAIPREVFVLDLIQAIGRCSPANDALSLLAASAPSSSTDETPSESVREELEEQLAHLLSQMDDGHRDAARSKTSGNWERKLVRLLVSDERLEPFLGSALAPTKMHVFLSAPTSFRCPGWSARQHLDFDLDHLCEAPPADDGELAALSTDTSLSSPRGIERHCLKRAPTSPLHSESQRWSKSACESSSSVADSWPEDSASDHVGESSMSSVSDDSRPPSAAEKRWHVGGASSVAEGWLPRCSSPLASVAQGQDGEGQSVETSRTASSLGSSTVYGHDSHDVAIQISEDMADGGCSHGDPPKQGMTSPAHDLERGVQRRSREPKAGSLLSRNLLRGHRSRQHSSAASDSSSVRSVASSLHRAPRCAGLQIDFTDPEQAAATASASPHHQGTAAERPAVERCWFQCETVLEGFR